MRTSVSAASAACSASARGITRTRAMASVSWRPRVKKGFSALPGFWKIIAATAPRSLSFSASLAPTTSWPSSCTLPVTRPGGGTRPRQASAVIDLPLPDSPTSPITSPLATSRSAPRTAFTVRSRLGNSIRRSRISRRLPVTAPPSAGTSIGRCRGLTGLVPDVAARGSVARLMLGIEGVAHPIADEIDREHGDEDGKPGEGNRPPIVEEPVAGKGGHQPPFRRRRLGADADEAEGGGGQDGIAEIHRALDDDGRQRIGQRMAQHDADIAHAHGPGRRNVELAFDP